MSTKQISGLINAWTLPKRNDWAVPLYANEVVMCYVITTKFLSLTSHGCTGLRENTFYSFTLHNQGDSIMTSFLPPYKFCRHKDKLSSVGSMYTATKNT